MPELKNGKILPKFERNSKIREQCFRRENQVPADIDTAFKIDNISEIKGNNKNGPQKYFFSVRDIFKLKKPWDNLRKRMVNTSYLLSTNHFQILKYSSFRK